ncbi:MULTISPECIES: hypothetical protein [Rhodococcus]|nr:hypothetical protein [Rhodococcus jostii]
MLLGAIQDLVGRLLDFFGELVLEEKRGFAVVISRTPSTPTTMA